MTIIVYHERAVEGRSRFVGDESRRIQPITAEKLFHPVKRWRNLRKRPSSHNLTRSREPEPAAAGGVT